jgi:hypothetical protein
MIALPFAAAIEVGPATTVAGDRRAIHVARAAVWCSRSSVRYSATYSDGWPATPVSRR